ncbi:MAG TPA: TRAP transporter substrate-binding protein DctP, partial [Polyangia bacterium]
TRLPGVFQSRDEAADAINRLNPSMVKEAHDHGFALLTAVSLGPDVIFTRTPVHSLAELRKIKLWRWDLDEVGIATSREMGLQIVPLPVSEAAHAYDEAHVDGFLAIPMAALAFQWSSRARYVTDLRGSYIWSCLVMTERSLQRLPAAYQESLRVAAAARARALRGDGPPHRRGAARRAVRAAGRRQRAGVGGVPRRVQRVGARGAQQGRRSVRAGRARRPRAADAGRLSRRARQEMILPVDSPTGIDQISSFS